MTCVREVSSAYSDAAFGTCLNVCRSGRPVSKSSDFPSESLDCAGRLRRGFRETDNASDKLAYSATSLLTQTAPGRVPLLGRSLRVGLQAQF